MAQVRVRFAPSPTGFFHIGSARTALFNWIYARHTGGVFVLRIEDTDKERNTEEFLNVIYDSLTWLGLNWDEGPKVGGAFGPYRQSERSHVYRDYLEKLKTAGRTYEKDGAVYFRISGAAQVIEDAIRGRVERTEEKDFVIVRSDGSPVFHFVNVVDDITMRITHVIRGEDHLSNTSKHTELFQAFGAPLPVYAHIPLILKSPEMGKGKMSKRDKGALVEQYRDLSFLPVALFNYLALLGWNPGGDLEKMPIEEIIRRFDLPGINQSNARFDEKKLAHMNMVYLLELPADRYVALAQRHFESVAAGIEKSAERTPEAAANLAACRAALGEADYFRRVVLLAQPKLRAIAEILPYTAYFFTDDYAVDATARAKVLGKGDPKARLQELIALFEKSDFASEAALEQSVKDLAAGRGLGLGDYVHPGRLAVSGTNVGPSFFGLLHVLGRERVLGRMTRFMAKEFPAPASA